MGVDRQLTFEILLYLNIFYFGLYAGMEAIFLLMKYYYVADMDNLTMLNEVFLLLALTGLESARLYLGQEEFIHKKISVVFRILLLTVPAQYLTLYFTFWQTKVTQVGLEATRQLELFHLQSRWTQCWGSSCSSSNTSR